MENLKKILWSLKAHPQYFKTIFQHKKMNWNRNKTKTLSYTYIAKVA